MSHMQDVPHTHCDRGLCRARVLAQFPARTEIVEPVVFVLGIV